MGKKQPKTEGLEWLIHSLGAFNGAGYADMDSPEDFLASYVAYKSMRKQPKATRLAEIYKDEALYFLGDLLEKTYGASRRPTEKNLDKFAAYRRTTQAKLF